MAVTIVQQADSASSPNTSPTLGTGVTAGDKVLLLVIAGTTVTAVSGLGATWSAIGSPVLASGFEYQWWIGANVITGTVVTLNNSAYWYISEVSGAGAPIDGGHGTGTSNSPSLTVTGLVANDYIIVMENGTDPISTPPSSPWANYSGGGPFAPGGNVGIASQTASGSSNQTAPWTLTGSGTWATVGLIVPATATSPAPSWQMQPLIPIFPSPPVGN